MHRKITVASCFDRGEIIPMIRLRGRWLRRAGFQEGQRLRLEVEDGKLILSNGDDCCQLYVER